MVMLRTVWWGSTAAGTEKSREKNWNSNGPALTRSPGRIWTGTDRSMRAPLSQVPLVLPVHQPGLVLAGIKPELNVVTRHGLSSIR